MSPGPLDHYHTATIADTLVLEHLVVFHSYSLYELQGVHPIQLHQLHDKGKHYTPPRDHDEDVAYEDQSHGG